MKLYAIKNSKGRFVGDYYRKHPIISSEKETSEYHLSDGERWVEVVLVEVGAHMVPGCDDRKVGQ